MKPINVRKVRKIDKISYSLHAAWVPEMKYNLEIPRSLHIFTTARVKIRETLRKTIKNEIISI